MAGVLALQQVDTCLIPGGYWQCGVCVCVSGCCDPVMDCWTEQWLLSVALTPTATLKRIKTLEDEWILKQLNFCPTLLADAPETSVAKDLFAPCVCLISHMGMTLFLRDLWPQRKKYCEGHWCNRENDKGPDEVKADDPCSGAAGEEQAGLECKYATQASLHAVHTCVTVLEGVTLFKYNPYRQQ